MTLATGIRIGQYEVVSLVGAGGMGEVYRARDTVLGRDAALKVLPPALAADADRVARFHREARTLAALNHPHIAQVFGVETVAGVTALAMEFVDGEDLAARLRRGPLPVDDVLSIARQVADALDAAHTAGIVHRDLKPANIVLRADGVVKVLDFGLAKAVDLEPAVDQTHSPTITTPAHLRQGYGAAGTDAGVILGTAAYMSPEQARGKPVDKRTDIWAFGCVVYELLTGRRAFEGETVTDVLSAIVRAEPDWNRLPAATPEPLRRTLRRCLAKDRAKRLPDIGAALLDIDEASDSGSTVPAPSPSPLPAPRGWLRLVPWLIATVLAGALLVPTAAPDKPVRASEPLSARIELGTDATLLAVANTGGTQRGLGASAVISPDGRVLAFVALDTQGLAGLYARRLDQLEATQLSGTEGAGAPFFSPDGRWIGFFADSALKKVPVEGGSVVTLCDARAGRGAAWGPDGAIVFAEQLTGLFRVGENGGSPQALTKLAQGEVTHRWPHHLPERRGVLFTVSPFNAGPFDAAWLAVAPPDGGPPKVVLRNATFGRYLDSGHLLFVRAGTLFAVRFDLDSLETAGEPVPVRRGVSYEPNTGVALLDVSKSGTLVYVDDRWSSSGSGIEWLSRDGTSSVLRSTPSAWNNPSFSPDGRRLAFDVGTRIERDVWLYDISRNVATRLTFGGGEMPVWSADGSFVAFRANRGPNGVRTVHIQSADGAGEPIDVTDGTLPAAPQSWHPDGSVLAVGLSGTSADVVLYPIARQGAQLVVGTPRVFLASRFAEGAASFSPDGRWLAYTSNESGRNEVYVTAYPGPRGKWQVSTDGGQAPAWARKSELVYQAPDGQLIVAQYRASGDVFEVGSAVRWPGSRQSLFALGRGRALSPDGQRIAREPEAALAASGIDRVVLTTGLREELTLLIPKRP